MGALFIGHAYTDITMVTDYIPAGDEKYVGEDYAFGVGGNAVVAALTAAKLGARTDLICQHANDRLGDMILKRFAQAGIRIIPRAVKKSSVSFIMPNNGQRAILRCRDTDYAESFPDVSVQPYRALHLDGHQPDAALHYAKKFRAEGKLTSLDGGSYERKGINELLEYIDVAIVSERFCEQMGKQPKDVIAFLLEKGCKVAGVTLGADGIIFSEGDDIEKLPALPIQSDKVIDTTGAGDIFHGAYISSYLLNQEDKWLNHLKFARAASALSIQKLGAENSIPNFDDVKNLLSFSN